MRKIVLGLLAATAVAAPIAMAASSANAATTDANGTISVSKGDVQKAMGWTNDQFQTHVNDIAFTGDVATVRYNLATCTDGTTYDRYAITHYTGGSVTANPVKNAQNKVTGFTLAGDATGGTWAAPWTTYRINGAWCPDTVAYGPDTMMPTEVTSVQVDGKDVPVTPYVAPAA